MTRQADMLPSLSYARMPPLNYLAFKIILELGVQYIFRFPNLSCYHSSDAFVVHVRAFGPLSFSSDGLAQRPWGLFSRASSLGPLL